MTDTELIDAYLHQELSGPELAQVEERLRTDGAFREEVELQRALATQVRAEWAAQKLAQFKQWEQAARQAEPPQPHPPALSAPKAFPWVRLGWVAVALLALVAFWRWLNHDEQPQTGQKETPAQTQPASDRIFLNLALQLAGGQGMAGQARPVVDQPTLLDTAGAQYALHYRFLGDTLELFVRGGRPAEVRAWRLSEQEAGLRYLLMTGQATYAIERGRAEVYPLAPGQ
jgi:anti-sigma factor RsiW